MRTGQYSLFIWTVYVLTFPATDVRATDIRKVDSDTRSLTWGKWSSWNQCIRGRKAKYRYGVKSRKLELLQKEILVCHSKPVGAVNTEQKPNYQKERNVLDDKKGTGLEMNRVISKLANLTETAASKTENNVTESNWTVIKPSNLLNLTDEKKWVSSNDTNPTNKETPTETMLTAGENDHEIVMDTGEADSRIQDEGNTAITTSSSSNMEQSQSADDPDCKRKVTDINCPFGYSGRFPCGRLYKNGTMTSSCYKIVNHRADWESAVKLCDMFSSKLVSLESNSENRHVRRLLKNLEGEGDHYWTSGSDKEKEGSWEWTATGEPVTSTHWFIAEPDNLGNEDHLAVRTVGASALTYWTDKKKTKWFRYICEISVRDTEV